MSHGDVMTNMQNSFARNPQIAIGGPVFAHRFV